MRRLLPLGLAVTVLLALAGIASHGRPLAGSRGRGPTATFFDYVATTLVIFAIVMLAIVVYTLFGQKVVGGPPRRGRWHLVSSFISFLQCRRARVRPHPHRLRAAAAEVRASAAETAATPGAGRAVRVRRPTERAQRTSALGRARSLHRADRRNGCRARCEPADEARAAPVAARAQRGGVARDRRVDRRSPQRSEPPPRDRGRVRADGAGARSCRAFPRHPAEAPFEYVERALRSLDTSTDSIRRLTALFERAKFSQHEPEPEMRDEAIDALVAVRDELARPVEEAVA